MKLILGDLHAGEKDGSELIMKHQLDILDGVIQYCLDNKITHIIQTGDMFDVRKSTNTKVLYEWKQRFFNKLKENNITMETIVSNHDAYYKNTLTPNTLVENLSGYDNITIYSEPTEVGDILFVPWICADNEEQCLNAIKNTKKEICVLHPEIVGAKMDTTTCTDGLSLSLFNKFKCVIAGHFHTRGTYNNVTYVGTPYEMTWTDYGVKKGFHLLDGSDLTFVEIKDNLFYRFTYDDDKDLQFILDTNLENKYVKLVVENRNDFKKYDNFITKLQNKGMQDLRIIEPLLSLDADDTMVEFTGELKVKDTEELISDYILDLYPEKSTKLNKMMLSLHHEARSL